MRFYTPEEGALLLAAVREKIRLLRIKIAFARTLSTDKQIIEDLQHTLHSYLTIEDNLLRG